MFGTIAFWNSPRGFKHVDEPLCKEVDLVEPVEDR